MRRFGILTALGFVILSCAPAQAWSAQEIKPFVRGSYQKIVSARQGKPFIVNFWSLTCSYCMVELEILGKLARKHPGLDLVMVSTDTPEDKELVSATLRKFSLDRTEAWVFADDYTERLRYGVDRKWQGELPRTYFFGAGSNEAIAVSGKVEQEDVEQWIEKQHGL